MLTRTISSFDPNDPALHEKLTELATTKGALKGLRGRKKAQSLPSLGSTFTSSKPRGSSLASVTDGLDSSRSPAGGNSMEASGYLVKGTGGIVLGDPKAGNDDVGGALTSALGGSGSMGDIPPLVNYNHSLDDDVVRAVLLDGDIRKAVSAERSRAEEAGPLMYRLSTQQKRPSQQALHESSSRLYASKSRYLGSGLRLPREMAVLEESAVKDQRTRGSVKTMLKALVSDNPEVQRLKSRENSRISNF